MRTANAVTREQILGLFREHLVLFFKEQTLTPPELVDVGRLFGEPADYPFIEGLTDAPQVIPIIKEAHERKNFGEGWHSDTTYSQVPPKATLLYAVEVPTHGGDTLFANMVAAHDALSDGMQRLLAPLRAVNSSAKRRGGGRAAGNQYASVKLKARDEVHEAVHPVARTHPDTGRRALYVNALHTARIDGCSAEESAPLLEFLYRHAVRPEFTCRYRWQRGTLAIWDNRTTQHFALNDYHGQRRAMWRLTIAGEPTD